MAQLDHQLGVVDESTYNTLVTVSRFFEFNEESIHDDPRRTEGEPLRSGWVNRSDRFTPYYGGASGGVTMDVMSKGFGFWLKHIFGQVVTSGPVETAAYTHTATMADLLGKSFSLQLNKPFYPTGTNQPMTFGGGKVNSATFANDVEENLTLELDLDFASADTATALATAAYPTLMDNLTWAGGVITVGGTQVDVTSFSCQITNNLNTDRRYIRGNTAKKEPTGGRRSVEWSLECDFDSLAQRTRAMSTTRAGALAAIVGTWTGPSLIVGATTLFPQLQLTIPAGRVDSWESDSDADGASQSISGVGLYDGTNSPVTAVYRSADTTA